MPQTDTQKSVNAQTIIILALLFSPLSLCIFALIVFIMAQIKKPIYCKMSLGNTSKKLARIKMLPKTAKTVITLFIETLLINCFFVTTDVFIIANGLVSLIFSLVNISILDMLP